MLKKSEIFGLFLCKNLTIWQTRFNLSPIFNKQFTKGYFMRKFLHIGIPSSTKMDSMSYAENMKLSITDPSKSPNNIERVYFDFDSPMPKLLQESTHIAYQVDDLDKALKNANILVAPVTLGNMRLAFIVEEEIPIELIQML